MHKILIANRGAIARRVIRSAHKLGLETVAIYSEADAAAPYLAEATHAYSLKGFRAEESYLDQDQLFQVLQDSGADAVHPGYGFLSEHAGFADEVRKRDATFIGPSSKLITDMGDKVSARKKISALGFPIFAGSDLVDEKAALVAAEQMGYPLLIKPSGGGGGLGMIRCANEEQLKVGLAQARAVAERAFASSGVYLERYIQKPRHVEFQILGDGRGGAIHAFERDCSIQRRNQKLIEESPAPGLDEGWLLEQADKAAAACAKLNYDNAGTLETLVGADNDIGFLEMNTRIQVEHGVTEGITGMDLVAEQIRLAQGAPLPANPKRSGHAIEARIYAEDSQTLLPSTGRISVYRPPKMHAVRVETGYGEGQEVTPYYDAMLAKVIAHAPTRELAIGRLSVALQAFEIKGVRTNQALLLSILGHADFLAGKVDTQLLERMRGGS